MKLKKDIALKNMESQLLISSPGTRNNDKIKLSHFYTTAVGDMPFYTAGGNSLISNSLEPLRPIDETSNTDISINVGNGSIPSED